MILPDLNQTTFSVMFAQAGKKIPIDENLLRHIILNCIRSYNVAHKEFGELVICSDSTNNWRKDIFPYYKANRKQSRDASTLNWTEIFTYFDNIKSELNEFFPYPLIQVDKAEADDIIAEIPSMVDEKILILSGDTDFVQLHNDQVSQYDIVRKRKITNKNKNYLKEHIIEGDRSDGIPNILSADDTFFLKKRMKTLTTKKKDMLIATDPNLYPSVEKRNYQRNKELIDLTCTPEDIKLNIRAKYVSSPRKDKSKLFNYFYDKKLTKFISSIQEF